MEATALATPPSTASVPSNDKAVFKRSPYEPTRRTLRENLTAGMKYRIEVRVSPTMFRKTIIASARATIHSNHWAELLKAEPVVDAVNAVASMGYSDAPAFDYVVTNMLNLISRSYVEIVHGRAGDTTPAVVFSGPVKSYIPGDYLAACSKPDTTAFMATWALLMKALGPREGKPFIRRQEFMDLLGVGEWKPKKILDVKGQLLWYLAALKRYRPDLDIVYGLFIVDNALRIVQHSACGSVESLPVSLDHVETWVAFVVLLYHGHQSRDDRFAPTPRPDRLARWSVRTSSSASSIFRPFHAGHSPGRVTWLAFEQDAASPQLASGFLKVSWQDASSKFNEPDLLDRAHKDGWLPGLVRHHWAQRIVSTNVSLAGSTRVKEIVHLASIGDPLSQCKSVLHLFKVVFDAIGVHENLMGEDIIHRDLSWFNLLCNPRHHPSTARKPVKLGVPTIDFVLTGEPSEPCALVLDLDHAGLMTELYSSTYEPRDRKSGTPMFVAVELSAQEPQRAGLPDTSVLDRLEAFDKLPEVFRNRLFPDDDGKFMDVFRDIFERECSRHHPRHKDYNVTTDQSSLHRPRHDMESLFWIVLWALLRASPLPKTPATPRSDVCLRTAAQTLLSHSLNADESLRNHIRTQPPVYGLHQLLSKFGGLLKDMAGYISIPWHLYERSVEGLTRNHAHIAFRRMLLVEIHKLSLDNTDKDAVEDVLFNSRVPRNIRDESNFGQDLGSLPPRSTGTPYSPYLSPTLASSDASQNLALQLGSGNAMPLSLAGAASQRGSKRSNADLYSEDVEQPQPSTKRSRAAPKAAAAAGPAEQSALPEQSVSAAQPDTEAQDDSRSIDRLIKAFFSDRNLWFGVGDHLPQKDPSPAPDGAPAVETDDGRAAPVDDAPAA